MPFMKQFSNLPKPKKDILQKINTQLSRNDINKQVLLSFIGDPYCKENDNLQITRQVLSLLNDADVPTAILTKGGERCLADIDIIKKFKKIKVGATLTFDNDEDSVKWEPGAALPEERMNALRILKKEGIQTWASFEPVIDPEQTKRLIIKMMDFIDVFKIGKWNHDSKANSINWDTFTNDVITLLRKYNKKFYIKKDLQKYAKDLSHKESNEDYYNL